MPECTQTICHTLSCISLQTETAKKQAYRHNVLDDPHMRQRIDLSFARFIYFAAKHITELDS